MLKIRLTRIGKKHQPTYRIVVTPKENPVAGRYLDLVGTYNPIKGDVQIDNDKVIAWLDKGAQPSERIARLLDKAGIVHNLVVVKHYEPKKKEEVAEEAAPEAPAETTEEATDEVATEEAAEETSEPTEETETPEVEPSTEEATEEPKEA